MLQRVLSAVSLAKHIHWRTSAPLPACFTCVGPRRRPSFQLLRAAGVQPYANVFYDWTVCHSTPCTTCTHSAHKPTSLETTHPFSTCMLVKFRSTVNTWSAWSHIAGCCIAVATCRTCPYLSLPRTKVGGHAFNEQHTQPQYAHSLVTTWRCSTSSSGSSPASRPTTTGTLTTHGNISASYA